MKKYLFICFCILIISESTSQNIFDLKNSLLFAEYLSKTKQYNYAAQEYERICFLLPNNDRIKLKLLSSYRKAGNYSQGILRAEEMCQNINIIPDYLAIEYINLLLLNNSLNQAKNIILNNLTLKTDDKLIMQLKFELFNKNWYDANKLFYTNNFDTLNSLYFKELKKYIDESVKLKYKSPVLALGLSAILPGAGKFYTNDWKDGIISFIIVSTCAWHSYRGFFKNGINSSYGWIYAGLSFGFYTGNIYGSYKSAKKYNKRLDDNIYNNTLKIINRD